MGILGFINILYKYDTLDFLFKHIKGRVTTLLGHVFQVPKAHCELKIKFGE